MFLLRIEQFAAFEQEQRRTFEQVVFLILQECWNEKVTYRGFASTREAIRMGIERARLYGLRCERGAFTYINLMFLYGDDFDKAEENQLIRELLADTSIDPDEKIRMLLDEVPKENETLED